MTEKMLVSPDPSIRESAGAASLALHNGRIREITLYQKVIILLGSITVVITMTSDEHRDQSRRRLGQFAIYSIVKRVVHRASCYQMVNGPPRYMLGMVHRTVS